MNIKKFMVVGLVGLLACVGCGQTQETSSQNIETESTQATPKVAEASPEVSTEPVAEEPTVDLVATKNETAKEQVQTLASLIGKKAEEVDAVLGEPASVQNLEDTDILLVRYYKVDYLDEVAKIEVVFNDNEQVVNYVSFVLMKADALEDSKETFTTALTELCGEPTIERYLGKNGRQNRNWYDETLTYELTYYENNISLDIYPSDK